MEIMQNNKNTGISKNFTSAELGPGLAELRSGSAELGSALAELQILGNFIKLLLKSSRSSLRASSETRRSWFGSSAWLGSQNLGKPWKITRKCWLELWNASKWMQTTAKHYFALVRSGSPHFPVAFANLASFSSPKSIKIVSGKPLEASWKHLGAVIHLPH